VIKIDFAWILFIGMNKLGFTEKQVGHMTWGKFSRLYNAYKRSFDNELTMKIKGIMYSDLDKEITIDDVIPV
jgi:hypothetical protein